MQNFDYIFIGAGISAYGAVSALLDSKCNRKNILVITGGAITRPALAMSRIAPIELDTKISIEQFGLPAVRAFGDGGTTTLWHGGLFVPHPLDEIRSADDAIFGKLSLPSAIDLVTLSPILRRTEIGQLLQVVSELHSLDMETQSHDGWRKLLIPRRPPLLKVGDLANLSQKNAENQIIFDDGFALEIFCDTNSSGRSEWVVRIVNERGFRSVSTERLFLCSGCLSSLKLLAQLTKAEEVSFSDHLHVFAGTIQVRKLPKELHEHLNSLNSVDSHSIRSVWKTTVSDRKGRLVDVALSFRRVANADFPRAGRRFGEMVGARANSVSSKLLLGLRNPLTAIEMIAFKNGYNLPFPNALIHATIAPRYPVGKVFGNGISFHPDREELSRCAVEAVSVFAQEFSLGSTTIRSFPELQIAEALISGAQFCAGDDLPPELLDSVRCHKSTLTICDTSSIGFSSVHNQGLLTLLQSYYKGKSRIISHN